MFFDASQSHVDAFLINIILLLFLIILRKHPVLFSYLIHQHNGMIHATIAIFYYCFIQTDFMHAAESYLLLYYNNLIHLLSNYFILLKYIVL